MKIATVLVLLLPIAFSTWANEIHRQVERASDLERELAFRLSVQDKHDVWRADGLDKIFPINGPSPEYIVRFHAAATGKLKDVFGLTLTLMDTETIVLQVPLALRTKWNKEDELSVEFLIRKDMIDRAELNIRCGLPNREESYSIQLVDYAK
jgi:hypothetical protein